MYIYMYTSMYIDYWLLSSIVLYNDRELQENRLFFFYFRTTELFLSQHTRT